MALYVRFGIILAFFYFLLALYSSFVQAKEIHVAVASNFAPVLKEIAPLYEKFTQEKIVLTQGSTGKLYTQIIHGAPYDLFFSADQTRADLLAKKQRGSSSDTWIYAKGRLALYTPNHQCLPEKIPELLSRANSFALANPETAPYGKAAMEFLEKHGLWEKFKNKAVYGENIAQAYHFMSSGDIDAGLLAYSQLKANPSIDRRTYCLIPVDQHSPIIQKAVSFKKRTKSKEIRHFVSFLKNSPKVKEIIQQHGYSLEAK